MTKYYFTLPDSVTLPTDGNKVSLTTACELHRDDSALPNALTVAAGAYNVFLADTPGTGTATAADVTAPTLLSTSPADNATDVAVGTVIDLVFSETVALGTGNIVLRDNDGGFADLETFNAATGTGDGGGTLTLVTTTETNDTVRITPGADLANSIEHAVRVASTAVEDTATTPNAFAGIADDTTVSFTTAAAVSGPTLRGSAGIASVYYGTSPSIPLDAGITEGDFVIVYVSGAFLAQTPSAKPSWLTEVVLLEPRVVDAATGAWARVYAGTAPSSPPSTADFTFSTDLSITGGSIVYDSGTLGNTRTDDSADVAVASFTTTGVTVLDDSAVAVIAVTSNQNLGSGFTATPAIDLLVEFSHSQSKRSAIVNFEGLSAGTSTPVAFDSDSADSFTTRYDVATIEVRAA